MHFCPTCGTLLQLEPASSGHKMRFFCPCCPFICAIEAKIVSRLPFKKKEIDPIMRWEDIMSGQKKTQAPCQACHNNEAYFCEMQIRSADEPMTTFYTCTNEACKYQWRED